MKPTSSFWGQLFSDNRKMIALVCALVVLLFSFFGLYNFAKVDDSSASWQTINESKQNVDKITLLAAGAATTLALIPDDSTTPVANEIADVASKLIIVSVSLTIEEIIVKCAPALCFRIAIPIVCVMYIISFYKKTTVLRKLAARLLAVSLCLFLAIPVSTFINQQIDSVVNTKEKLNQLFAASTELVDQASKYVETNNISTQTDNSTSSEQESQNRTVFQAIGNWINTAWNDVGSFVSGIGDSIVEGITDIVQSTSNLLIKARDLYSIFNSAIVAMIISDCVVPIVTLYIMYRFVRLFIYSTMNFLNDDKKYIE